MMSKKPYKRIRGLGRSILSYTRLWLAADHLLLLESTAFTESYRRFYFKDIEAFIVRRTKNNLISSIILLIIAAVLTAAVVILIREADSNSYLLFWLLLPGLFYLLALVGFLSGPSCVFYIRTGVQEERVKSIRTLRAARKLVDRVQPFLEAQQDEANREAGVMTS